MNQLRAAVISQTEPGGLLVAEQLDRVTAAASRAEANVVTDATDTIRTPTAINVFGSKSGTTGVSRSPSAIVTSLQLRHLIERLGGAPGDEGALIDTLMALLAS